MNDKPTLPAIVVDGVSKKFRIPHERVHTLKERALHPLRSRTFNTFNALDGVSFTVPHGEFFGIVGRNGSGKSTLLKCMAGIYGIDAGSIYINGRLSTFIELGVGFNLDLAAEDNVVLNGIMLGLSPAEARERVDRVIEFAGLEEFVDLKLKNYSSGMAVRLAFSVMIQVDADILLIDEVLAVGDASFQQKCFGEFNRLRDEGRTALLVTHDMAAVTRFCDRAMLIDSGKIIEIGDSQKVSEQYFFLNFRQGIKAFASPEELASGAMEHPDAVMPDAWFEDENGTRTTELVQGRPCSFNVIADFNTTVEDPSVAFTIEDEGGQVLFSASSIHKEERTGTYREGDRMICSTEFENPFGPGRYFVTVTVAQNGSVQQELAKRERWAPLRVTGELDADGHADLPREIRIEQTRTFPGTEVAQ